MWEMESMEKGMWIRRMDERECEMLKIRTDKTTDTFRRK
jgi:hypothetical protein